MFTYTSRDEDGKPVVVTIYPQIGTANSVARKQRGVKTGEVKSMKTCTLNDAVEEAINMHLHTDRTFSAHDITKVIRNAANDGTYVLSDCVQRSDGKFEVEHNQVKTLVRDFVNKNNLSHNYNGNYTVYGPPVKPSNPTNSVAINITKNSALDRNISAQLAIANYLGNKQPRTLKQIQSTIRRKGNFTCVEIRDYIKSNWKNANVVDATSPSFTTVTIK